MKIIFKLYFKIFFSFFCCPNYQLDQIKSFYNFYIDLIDEFFFGVLNNVNITVISELIIQKLNY